MMETDDLIETPASEVPTAQSSPASAAAGEPTETTPSESAQDPLSELRERNHPFN